jgi:hypothetical protein
VSEPDDLLETLPLFGESIRPKFQQPPAPPRDSCLAGFDSIFDSLGWGNNRCLPLPDVRIIGKVVKKGIAV